MTPSLFLLLLSVVAGTAPCTSAAVSVRLVSGDGPSSPLSEPQPKQRGLIRCGNGSTSLDDTTIDIATDLWFADRESAVEKYGEISTWGTCGVTSFNWLFDDRRNFNEDISQWDTGTVTDMYYAFAWASFNGDLGGWDVANVQSMHGMFYYASSFNQDLSGWDVTNIRDINRMFLWASDFNQDLSGWSVQAVTDMSYMFLGASSFNQDLSQWSVQAVTSMREMF